MWRVGWNGQVHLLLNVVQLEHQVDGGAEEKDKEQYERDQQEHGGWQWSHLLKLGLCVRCISVLRLSWCGLILVGYASACLVKDSSARDWHALDKVWVLAVKLRLDRKSKGRTLYCWGHGVCRVIINLRVFTIYLLLNISTIVDKCWTTLREKLWRFKV